MFSIPQKEDLEKLPIVALRGQPIFPNMVFTFKADRELTVNAINAANDDGGAIVIVAQNDPYLDVEEIDRYDLYHMGTLAEIKQVVKHGDDIRVTVKGLARATIYTYEQWKPYFIANVKIEDEPKLTGDDALKGDVFMDKIKTFLRNGSFTVRGTKDDEVLKQLDLTTDHSTFADLAAACIYASVAKKQAILEEMDVLHRLLLVATIAVEELHKLSLQDKVEKEVHDAIDKQQREYYLREELKVIQEELGEGGNSEINEYRKLLTEKNAPEEVIKKCEKEIAKLREMPAGSPEASISSTYLDWVTSLPWGIKTEENTDIDKAGEILEADHYGLEKVKERILEFLAVRKLTGGAKAPIICLVGAPGVGKTSVARSIASASGRNYVRISLGGVRDEAEIRGHRKTYIGAMPGRIIAALKKAGSSNPLILLDEIDKISSDYKGDPSAALLEVLDSEQNSAFRDHFVELDVDLSDVMFVTTANSVESIDRPLLDRMEVIEIPGYTEYDKINIAQKHLVPKLLLQHGITAEQFKITDDAVAGIISGYTREAGVRGLERKIAQVMRKAAATIVKSGAEDVTVENDSLEEFLGKRIFRDDEKEAKNPVGVVNGLAWTTYGGDQLCVEANCMSGKGKTKLTGSLGDVMKESAEAAVSFIRSRAGELGIDSEFYKTTDIHIHVPDGATPKDGPSAGITIASAVISALTGRAARSDVAMTGEITLRGRVLRIGGLREKALAAYRAGIKTIIIPKSNVPDLEDIPKDVADDITFVPVEDMSEVVKAVFE